ncbi:MAG: 50S ribosomal protein L21 [Candidatus Omnitrophica bacterium]|jgi:large subunit ribosomal protein L21|nr:50S ribosomal protein L21 [Candidatus Omnitrophota bacterium]
MYAIIEVGAKQYSIKKGDVLDVEKLSAKKDGEISFDKVMLVSHEKKIEIGQPYLKNAVVKAELLGQVKGKKVMSFKYRRRKSSHWHKGHRQQYSRVKIKEIEIS